MTDALYPYQLAGVQFLRVAESALLADEMGTGKTVQTIATLEAEKAYPALIVAPNSVKSVWEREFAKWAPNRRVAVAGSGTASAEAAANDVASGAADVLIVNWEALKNLSRLAPFGSIRLESCSNCDPTSKKKPTACEREDKVLNLVRWAAVVADEAHRAKDPKSKQTRALWAIGDRAEHRFALTGTPIANSPEDLWSVMRFVAPQEYPAKWAWIERYAKTVPNIFSGGVDVVGLREDRREELDRYFLPRFLRRTKAQVLPDLPPKVYMRRDVTLSGKQKTAYDRMEKEMIAQVEGGVLTATTSLTAMLRLRQLASAFGEVTSDISWSGDASDPSKVTEIIDTQVRLTNPSSKLDVFEEVLEELGPRQVVIFAESKQLIDLAADRVTEGIFGKITGDIPADARAAYVEEFQAGHLQYMFCTAAAGGEGITLSAADTVIFLQRPWSQVLNKQAEDRIHRIGQTGESCTYIDLVAVGTVEERVFEALQKKAQVAEEVYQDDKEPGSAGGESAG
jgi:SNF2 family DNA or RNA helicase